MKNSSLFILTLFLAFAACNQGEKTKNESTVNPLLSDWDTPYGVPPFSEIETEHFMPAFEEAMKMHNAEIDAIISDEAEPDFFNTIEALEKSGKMLSRISNVFYNLSSANTNDAHQEVAQELSPLLSAHGDNITLNDKLFERVEAVYTKTDKSELDTEAKQLLEKTYKDFVRSGAALGEESKNRLREINSRLSTLSLTFGEHILKETNNYQLVIEDEAELAGLPESVKKAAAETAKEAGKEGSWVFTLQYPSIWPFMTYSENRDYRRELFEAYINRGNNGDDKDNKEILIEMANLRLEKANLLGYPTHADYVLEKNMAKTPDGVYELLDQLWEAAKPIAKAEAAELQKMIDAEKGGFELEAWDWWYYAEKLRKQKYDLDEEMLRPYFVLENVKQGAFQVANQLFGLQFEKRTDIPVYHPEATAYEVKEADGSKVGLMYVDFHPRASKRSGAWMTSYRKQSRENGENIYPVISMVMNFSKPTGDKPALLSFDEVQTLFHEFGHVLHGLLSDCNYNSLSGTSVPRDFVELPSQIMENWAAEPAVLKQFAKHYETGEVIPDDLLEKVKNSGHFNQGFAMTEYLAASMLDMKWHTISDPVEISALDFENNVKKELGMIDEIVFRYRSPYFQHIFSGGYSAGYYSYIWSEVLDADAFAAFKENGIFDQATAKAFRENVLSKGGTADPMELYKNFRGKKPEIDALLVRKGIAAKG